jgi:hypothetical protein|nr:hypothetical protein [Bacillaceae bacterium]
MDIFRKIMKKFRLAYLGLPILCESGPSGIPCLPFVFKKGINEHPGFPNYVQRAKDHLIGACLCER